MERSLAADIGVFGGSGFYSLIDDPLEAWVETPYGPPSDRIAVGEIAGKRVAFLPRHGKDHRFPPQVINYRANVYAMKSIGVRWLSGPSAAGSLKKDVGPGSMVVCDQIVDRTKARQRYVLRRARSRPTSASPIRTARPTADRRRSVAFAGDRNACHRNRGRHPRAPILNARRVEVVCEPRLGSINMTQYPECYLARELEMCYANISLITDYDVGLEGMAPVSRDAVIEIFNANNQRLNAAISEIVARIDVDADCSCRHALEEAQF